jgi:hypothetical protein
MAANFPRFSIIKEKVIRPLLMATEKVVEYYFPEEVKEASQRSQVSGFDKQSFNRSMGGVTKTTADTLSHESSELSSIRQKFQLLDISGKDSSELKASHTKNNRKRTYRQLERNSFAVDFMDPSGFKDTEKTPSTKSDKKGLKLNQKMLKKASATVDLISQKVKSKGMIQETVTSSFATNVIELTSDALRTITKEEALVEGDSVAMDINLRFIKPSKVFYNSVMLSWLKFLKSLEEEGTINNSERVLNFHSYAKSQ